ncbi:MAG: RluA family pseudouridine synthase [Candidatus Saccharibacteria bacterium]
MKLTPTADETHQRLDHFLTEKLPQVSRSFLQKLSDDKKITVNGLLQKNGYKLKSDDKIEIEYDFTDMKPADIELPIIYEDEYCLVINKPAGVLTHSKGAFNPEGTVASFAEPKTKDMTGDRAGIVHRLDRATSGIIIVAKDPTTMSFLQKQFSQRKVKKTYYAAVNGIPEIVKALIEVPIERNPKDPKTFRPGTTGKQASTEYEVIEKKLQRSLLMLKPFTGRTHQIRVHLKYIGHPIIGDMIYSGEPADRMFLHAGRLEVTLPGGERKVFEAPLSDDFHAILNV